MSFLSDLVGGALSFGQSAQQNYYNKKAASRAHDYGVYDYSHRHQWEVEDLKKAGLNPVLSANSGGSVSVPSAATVGMANTAQNALSIKQMRLLDAQTKATLADARVKNNTADISAPAATAGRTLDNSAGSVFDRLPNLRKSNEVNSARDSVQKFIQPAVNKVFPYINSALNAGRQTFKQWQQSNP